MPKGARSITRIRKVKVDSLDPRPATPADSLPINGVIILPRQSFEQGRGYVTIEGWDIYILPSSKVVAGVARRGYLDGDIVSSDLIDIDGKRWQVDGEPAPYDKGDKRKATLIKVKKVGT